MLAKRNWAALGDERCNGGIAAAIVLKSTTRASLMHEEHRRILLFKVEHEAEPATSFAESSGGSH